MKAYESLRTATNVGDALLLWLVRAVCPSVRPSFNPPLWTLELSHLFITQILSLIYGLLSSNSLIFCIQHGRCPPQV